MIPAAGSGSGSQNLSCNGNTKITKKADDLQKYDRISNLPDEMLIHILSFLPTKDLFRTSVLSYRWKNLWTWVPNLEFRPNPIKYTGLYTDEERSYVDFIKRKIVSHSSSINKVHISCTPLFDMSILKALISTMVEYNVQDLKIDRSYMRLQLPESLFTCKTLSNLKLEGVLQHHVPASICFPCLKVLHIQLHSPSSIFTQKLFCSSPVLEELKIIAIYEKSAGKCMYNISSPCLKKLYVQIENYIRNNLNCVVNINAPILDSLEVTQSPFVQFILKNSTALVKARLDFYIPEDGYKSFRLLESVSHVKDLSLCGNLYTLVNAISSQENCLVCPSVTHLTLDTRDIRSLEKLLSWLNPVFPDLIHLRVTLYDASTIDDLLTKLPLVRRLSTLVIVKSFPGNKINFLKQFRVPMYWSWYVKEIELLEFEGYHSELKIIEYLLENVEALKKLTVKISCPFGFLAKKPDLERQLFKKEIFLLASSSKQCKVLVI